MLTAFLLSFRLKADSPDRTQRFRISLKQIVALEVLLPTLVIFFVAFAYSGIGSFIAIYGGLRGVKEIGLYFTASAICMIFIRPISGKIADKYGHDKSIIPGLVILMAALVLISFSRSLPMFILAGVVAALGFGTSQPLLQAMIMQIVPKERRGAAGNTNFIGIDFAFLIGPTIAGAVITTIHNSTGNEVLGFSTMYRVMILPVIIALVIFLFNRKKLLTKIKTQQEALKNNNPESKKA
jgi:MFS family permease